MNPNKVVLTQEQIEAERRQFSVEPNKIEDYGIVDQPGLSAEHNALIRIAQQRARDQKAAEAQAAEPQGDQPVEQQAAEPEPEPQGESSAEHQPE